MNNNIEADNKTLTVAAKACRTCGEIKALDGFYKHPKTRDGYQGECKDCARVRAREWQRKNRGYTGLLGPRDAVSGRGRLTVRQYGDMLEQQGGVCAICGKPETNVVGISGKASRLAIDHCHDTGKVRGLLCMRCNTGLGKFYDNKDMLRKAVAYLDRSP